MKKLSSAAIRRLLRTLAPHRGSVGLDARLAALMLLVGQGALQQALADTDEVIHGISAADRAHLIGLRDELMQSAGTARVDEIAALVQSLTPEADASLQAALLSDPGTALGSLDAWLQAQIDAARALITERAEFAADVFLDDEAARAIESEYAGAEELEAEASRLKRSAARLEGAGEGAAGNASAGAAQAPGSAAASGSAAGSGAAASGVSAGAASAAAVAGQSLGIAPAVVGFSAVGVGAGVTAVAVTAAAVNSGGGSIAGSGSTQSGPGSAPISALEIRSVALDALRDAKAADPTKAFDGKDFDAATDVTLIVDGTTLVDHDLTLSDLALLGVDHVKPDVAGGAIDLALGLQLAVDRSSVAGNASADTHLFASLPFKDTVSKQLPAFDASALVTLGLNPFEMQQLLDLFDVDGSPSEGKDLFKVFKGAGIDRYALGRHGDGSSVGDLSLTLEQAKHLHAADATFADDFHLSESGDVVHTHLVVEATTLGDSGFMGAENLEQLGVDEVRFAALHGLTMATVSPYGSLPGAVAGIQNVVRGVLELRSGDPFSLDHRDALGTSVTATVRLDLEGADDSAFFADVRHFLAQLDGEEGAGAGGSDETLSVSSTILTDAQSDLATLLDLGVDHLLIGSTGEAVFDLHEFDDILHRE